MFQCQKLLLNQGLLRTGVRSLISSNVSKLRLSHQCHTEDDSEPRLTFLKVSGALFGAGVALYVSGRKEDLQAKTSSSVSEAGQRKNNLPEFSAEEVGTHDSMDKRIWVTYKSGVYDITDFIPKHPGGGGNVMMAAGGSVEPFWVL